VSEVVNTVTKIHIRYNLLDEDGYVDRSKWLYATEKSYGSGTYDYRLYKSTMVGAYDWVERYNGDVTKAMDMASRLAKIIKCGKKLLAMGWEWELVMVRDITRRTVTPVTNNAMAVLAVAALD
jgi:hypothetical protein